MSETVADVGTFWALDFDPVVPCDNGFHSRSKKYGCIPAESASWFVTQPCCNYLSAICNGFKNWLFNNCSPFYSFQCDHCQGIFFFENLIWTQIRGIS